MEETKRTEADAVAELSQKPFVESIEGIPHLLLPNDQAGWSHVDLSGLLDAPKRKRGTVTIHEVDSFILMAKRHGSLSDAMIYVDVD